jgi:hypothetical protein
MMPISLSSNSLEKLQGDKPRLLAFGHNLPVSQPVDALRACLAKVETALL